MRVISGSARGKKLLAPEGLDTRPTTDRIKETIFNIISPYIKDCLFLDLFSGSGAIGIEALSRGAKEAVFIDFSEECRKIIIKNLVGSRLSERGKVHKDDILSALYLLGKKGEKFDIIYLDPPYASGLYEITLESIVKNNLLNQDGMILAEHSTEIPISDISGLKIIREKKFKTTTITFFVLED